MPAWWGRKSTKNKGQQNQHQEEEFHCSRASIKTDNKSRDKLEGFDEASTSSNSHKSPRSSRDLGFSGGGTSGGSFGFFGFDSDSAERKGHPLPQPSISSSHGFVIDHGVGIGSGSASVSSVSSSGSSDDNSIAQNHGCQFVVFRGPVDAKMDPSTVWQNPISASDSPRTDSTTRSSGAGSRGPTSPTSPLNPRLCRLSLDSTGGKVEDGKSQCHPLPLPPGSPTSPSVLPNIRSVGASENASAQSCWKKGRLLGRGTFGHVYLGFNSLSGQMCAIKEVKVIGDDSSSKESLKQLNQEINLLSQLSHPNIVRYYGSEMGDEALSVYLEYVSGGSIYKLLQEYGAFKEPVIQNYTRKIVSGLAYLHARTTVHRDIKGANILVGPKGEIKLADFGMAKHITNCTSMLSFKGSPHWMAPEVVMNTNGYSLAVDIWSLGCTVLEMATSKPPWSKYEGVAAIFKIGNTKEIPEIPEHLSNDARSFVRLCLQREPSARPTAAQLLEHPFVRDHPSPRVLDGNIPNDFFPFAYDGSQTLPRFDHHANRKSVSNCDLEYLREPVITTSRAMTRSSENIRLITSLPVSPSSSPLRHYGHEQRSFLLSPPHPSYVKMTGQSGYSNLNDFSLRPMKPNTMYNLDPDPLIRVHTPGGSPRTRPMQVIVNRKRGKEA